MALNVKLLLPLAELEEIATVCLDIYVLALLLVLTVLSFVDSILTCNTNLRF